MKDRRTDADKGGRTDHEFAPRMVKLLNVLLMTGVFAFAWYAFYAKNLYTGAFFRKGNWAVIAVFLVLYIINGRMYDAFLISYGKLPEMVFSQALALFITNVLMWVVIFLVSRQAPAELPLLFSYGTEIIVSFFWCYYARRWYFHKYPPKKTFVVWDERRGLTQLIEDYDLSKKFQVLRTLPAKECLKDLSVLKGIDAVFLIGVHSGDRNQILKHCVTEKITVFVIPRIGDVILSGAKRMHLFHLPILQAGSYNPALEYLVLKRFLDIVLSLLALMILSPVILVTALIIKAEDGGTVFYRQTRLTKDGREFQILKFRSMRMDAEKDGVARLSTGTADDRVTKVGRKIRRTRIDELPQLINILKGDMSIVGPRPERPEIAEQYEKELPEFALRLQARAGLTGYAQVYGKYNTTPYDKLLMDLMYLAKPSLAEDVRISFATVKILASKISTEGVSERITE